MRCVSRGLLWFLLTLLPAWGAFAFESTRTNFTSGPSLTWPDREVGWFADSAIYTAVSGGSDLVRDEVLQSYASWENISCSDISLPLLGESSGLRREFNEAGGNQNVVIWVGEGWEHDAAAVALTTNAFGQQTGSLLDSDIEINGTFFDFEVVSGACDEEDGPMDLRNALTHEVGHLLGLDHENITGTTMFPSAPACETQKRTLHPDDESGICTIYPTGMPNAPVFPPETSDVEQTGTDLGFGCVSTSGRPQAALLLFGIFCGGFLFRRKAQARRNI